MGWVLCPPSFLAQSHIARLLRDHVAKAGPLGGSAYGPRCVRRYATDCSTRSPHGFGGGACYLRPVTRMALESPGLYTPSLLGTVSFMEGCDGEGRGTRVHRLPGGCRGRSLVSRRASADRWIWGCGMYARRGQFLRAEAALQPSLCKAAAAAAPASSFGISTITARTTVRRPAAK
jgi:hypothetical protein